MRFSLAICRQVSLQPIANIAPPRVSDTRLALAGDQNRQILTVLAWQKVDGNDTNEYSQGSCAETPHALSAGSAFSRAFDNCMKMR